VRITVVLDCQDPVALSPFWCTALGYRPAGSLPDYEVLTPAEGQPPGPVLLLQRVGETKVTKNRMHLDVHPPLEVGVPALVAKLEALGGRRVGVPHTGLLETLGIWWQLMVDPEGNELDLVADRGHPPPEVS
jgi:hypothetical protein